MKENGSVKVLVIILILIVILGGGFLAYKIVKDKENKQETSTRKFRRNTK